MTLKTGVIGGAILFVILILIVAGTWLLRPGGDPRTVLADTTWARQLGTGRNEALYRDDTITFDKDGETVVVRGYRDLINGTYKARDVNGGIEVEIFYGNRVFARATVRGSEMTVTYTFFQPAKFRKRP
jgi:hypothetical protein